MSAFGKITKGIARSIAAKSTSPGGGGGTSIPALWDLLNSSNGETLRLKFRRQPGDARPFRAIVFIEGEDAVARILALVEADQAGRDSAGFTLTDGQLSSAHAHGKTLPVRS